MVTAVFSLQLHGKSSLPIPFKLNVTTNFETYLSSNKAANENFKNEKLALIYDIFHNTNRKTIETYMIEKGFSEAEIDPAFDEFGELLTFNNNFGFVEVEYQTNGKVLNVIYTYAGAVNHIFIEEELEENQYKATTKKFKAGENFDEEFEKNLWNKTGTENRFVTAAIEAKKVGSVGYGILED